MEAESKPDVLERVSVLQKELRTKKSFITACRELTQLCEHAEQMSTATSDVLGEAGKTAFTVLRTRFSNPKFWQAGLDFFLALDFHVGVQDAASWRDAAMEEVDDEARERAQLQRQKNRLLEDKKHNKGRFSDAATPITMNELLAANGVLLIDGEDDRRPAMSRDARDELRVVTVLEEDLCVVCQESLIVGSKAKAMPCGHKFHDDCLAAWVAKSNSCPTCRFDELPSEKRHFDDVQRRVMQAEPTGSGLYA